MANAFTVALRPATPAAAVSTSTSPSASTTSHSDEALFRNAQSFPANSTLAADASEHEFQQILEAKRWEQDRLRRLTELLVSLPETLNSQHRQYVTAHDPHAARDADLARDADALRHAQRQRQGVATWSHALAQAAALRRTTNAPPPLPFEEGGLYIIITASAASQWDWGFYVAKSRDLGETHYLLSETVVIVAKQQPMGSGEAYDQILNTHVTLHFKSRLDLTPTLSRHVTLALQIGVLPPVMYDAIATRLAQVPRYPLDGEYSRFWAEQALRELDNEGWIWLRAPAIDVIREATDYAQEFEARGRRELRHSRNCELK